ncbi:MAG: lipid A deacylase LpxR family protein [Vicinamibacterales bacterium]
MADLRSWTPEGLPGPGAGGGPARPATRRRRRQARGGHRRPGIALVLTASLALAATVPAAAQNAGLDPARSPGAQVGAGPAAALAEPRAGDDAREPSFSGLSLLHDNDGLPNLGNTYRDDNYSAGMALRVSGRAIHDWRLTAPLQGLDWLTRVSRRHQAAALTAHGLVVVGAAYTPNDLTSTAPQRDDRPFASLLGVTVRRQSVTADLDRAWTSELTVGALGLGAARAVQTLLHRTRRWMTGNPVPPDPIGWPNQIASGGEPTALYRVAYDRRLAGARPGPGSRRWQITGGVEGSVGFQTNLAATVAARAGVFTSEFWEFATGTLSPGLGRQRRDAVGRRWELFVFGAARPRVVAYNALLQGQFRDSVHTVRPRHLVGEWEGGIAVGAPLWGYQAQVVVGLAQGRTTEWVGARATPSTWGTVSVVLSRPGPRPQSRRGPPELPVGN